MKKIYLILPILAGAMFASSGIFVRTLTQNNIDAITLLFLRFSIAVLAFLIAIILTDKNLVKINLKDLSVFIITAISMLGLNICYNQSMNSVPLSLAAVLLSTAPVFVIFLAYFLFREKITLIKISAMFLALIGCILTTGLLEENLSNISLIGIIGGIGAAVFWAIYTVSSRKAITAGKHTYTILLYSTILLTIALIPFTDFGQITNYINLNPTSNILFLILHSFISFAIPYISITLALHYIESGTASILTSGSEPLAATIFGIIFYSEVPTILTFTGIVLTIIAIILLTKTSRDVNSVK